MNITPSAESSTYWPFCHSSQMRMDTTSEPGLLVGWIYVVIVSIRELSSSILLYSPGTEVVSILIWELWENGQYVELSALGVMLIMSLFVLVLAAQWLGKKFGIREG